LSKDDSTPATPASDSQQTLKSAFSLQGRGLHSGVAASARVKPGAPDSGIVFRRVDLDDQPTIAADARLVSGVDWETVIGDGERVVRTVEHLLAALAAHRLDNLEIELDGSEPPALDGSAAGWCRAIHEVGIQTQTATAPVITVGETITVTEGASRYVVLPHEGFRVSARIEFDHPAIGEEYVSAEITEESFCARLAPARTFGLEEWAESLRERGLARGSSAENTIILAEDTRAEDLDLRFPDEFVRHKIVDVIGDLALVGARVRAHVIAERPSHRGNVALARRLQRLRGRGPDGGPVLDVEGIMEHLPHRQPFLLVDRVLEFEPKRRVLASKNVTINEPFFAGHFPGHPIMPGVLIVEGMAQAGGLLLMEELGEPGSKVVYFMALDDVRFRRPVRPGDVLEYEVELAQVRGSVFRMRGVARVDGLVVAEGSMMAKLVDR
jgi:UDP-3-O-[3-hydroxymyristoyl] N-acetylglucosamine deacetylase/3-hydroxyacyl-[acyl-carrier-protein] dehydratase